MLLKHNPLRSSIVSIQLYTFFTAISWLQADFLLSFFLTSDMVPLLAVSLISLAFFKVVLFLVCVLMVSNCERLTAGGNSCYCRQGNVGLRLCGEWKLHSELSTVRLCWLQRVGSRTGERTDEIVTHFLQFLLRPTQIFKYRTQATQGRLTQYVVSFVVQLLAAELTKAHSYLIFRWMILWTLWYPWISLLWGCGDLL